MIMVGSQRSGGQNLAAHLMRADDNEHVEVHEVNGFAADDLHGAFKEAEAVSRATKCKQYLFSMSLNPPEDADVPVHVFEDAISRIEKRLGLEGQPRAIVFHEKEGRRHAHCVWSRIDGETLTAKHLPFFKMKLQAISRELYLENDWQMPQGMIDSALRDPRNFSLAEWQQSKRSGIDPRLFKAAVQLCWERSDSPQAFRNALSERGLYLSRGNRRGHVIVDTKGEVWSLAKTLGIRTKTVKQRLGNLASLPSVQDSKTRIAEGLAPVISRHIRETRDRFNARSAALNERKIAMCDRHRAEREHLIRTHALRFAREMRTRVERLPKGFAGLWSRATGRYQKIKCEIEREHERCRIQDKRESEALVSKQLQERRKLQSAIQSVRNAQAELFWSLREDRHHLRKLDGQSRGQRERTRRPS